MLYKASRGERWETRELLQRLSALENGGAPPTDPTADRFERLDAKRKRVLRAYFALGFESSCIAGVVALLIILFMNSEPAHGNSAWLIPEARAELAFWFGRSTAPPRAAGPVRVHAVSAQRQELASEGRQLWWRLPI